MIAEDGVVVDLVDGVARIAGMVPCGYVYVDGASVGEITEADLKDRRILGEEGFISIIVVVDAGSGKVVAGPEIHARGFAEDEAVFDAVRPRIVDALRDAANTGSVRQPPAPAGGAPGGRPLGERVVPSPADDHPARDRGVTPQVVCVGGAVADRKYHLVGEPVGGTSNPARGTSAPGGVARNVAENLARLGVAVRLVSRVGDDDAGRALKRRLTAAGADVTHVTATRGFDTAEYVAVLDPDGELVIGVAAMDVFTAISVSDVDRGLADGAEWLFLDCNLPPALLEHGVAYGAAGVRVAVDAVSTVKVTRLPGDLGGIDLLFCNADEARAYLTDPSGAAADDAGVAARLLESGAGAVVLTRGAAGLVVADADGVREHEAVPADVVDVTGAGDALVAGTLAALLDGHDLDAAAAAGARLAALTVAVPETVRTDLELVRVPEESQEET